MENLVRVGFIGAGGHASKSIYPSLSFAPIDLVAVCDLVKEKAEHNARRFGARHAYTDYPQMFHQQELDAVFVVGGAHMHYPIGLEALRHGYHVFIEKPPCNNLAEAKDLLEASRASGKNLMTGYMKRFAPGYAKAKEITQSPAFGKIANIHIRFGHWSVSDFAHMMRNMHTHMLDLARFFGGEIVRLHVERFNDELGASLAISAKYLSGAVGTFTLDAHQPRLHERLEVAGGGNLLIVDNMMFLEHHKGTLGTGPNRVDFKMDDIQVWRPEFALPGVMQVVQGYVGEVREFANAILEGRPSAVNAQDVYESMRLVEAIERVGEGTIDLATVS